MWTSEILIFCVSTNAETPAAICIHNFTEFRMLQKKWCRLQELLWSITLIALNHLNKGKVEEKLGLCLSHFLFTGKCSKSSIFGGFWLHIFQRYSTTTWPKTTSPASFGQIQGNSIIFPYKAIKWGSSVARSIMVGIFFSRSHCWTWDYSRVINQPKGWKLYSDRQRLDHLLGTQRYPAWWSPSFFLTDNERSFKNLQVTNITTKLNK